MLPLIESNGFTFREVKRDSSEGSSDRRRDFMASQDDKIFESVDVNHLRFSLALQFLTYKCVKAFLPKMISK